MKKTHYAVLGFLGEKNLEYEDLYVKIQNKFPYMGTGVNRVNFMFLLHKLSFLDLIFIRPTKKGVTLGLTKKGRDLLNKIKKVK